RHICFTSHLVLHLCASLRRRHPRPTLFPTRRSSDLELIAGSLGTTPVLERLPMQPGDVLRTYADVSKARRLLGYEPTTPVEDGIPRFSAWLRGRSAIPATPGRPLRHSPRTVRARGANSAHAPNASTAPPGPA